MDENLSPNQKALRRLRKDKPAVFGLVLIAFAIFLALTGYIIAPDHSPDANAQSALIALKPPGFKATILKTPTKRNIVKQSWMKRFFNGSREPDDMIPLDGFFWRGDSLYIQRYSGGALQTEKLEKFHLVQVAYGTAEEENIKKVNNQYRFIDLQGVYRTADTAEALQEARKRIIEKTYLLGTDNFGRDILSRLILGVRISLLVGLIAVVISMTIGVALGAIAGYAGGRTDDAIMLLVNTVWSIPTILLVFAIVLAFGRGITVIFFAVGLTMWVDVARVVRGQTLALKAAPFIEAAASMGFSRTRIILRHILPNILGPVMVIAASNFSTAILIESGLSFLGFGVQPPTPSWGSMLNENYGYAIAGKPFLAFAPAGAIMLMVLAFNLVGNGFRDALDVKL